MENKKWYAVKMNPADNDWDTGSFDRAEAEKMVVNLTSHFRKDGYIVVIDVTLNNGGDVIQIDNIRLDEIHPEDFDPAMYAAYKINASETWANLDDEFAYLARCADMEAEWAAADGDNVETVIRDIFNKLDICLS